MQEFADMRYGDIQFPQTHLGQQITRDKLAQLAVWDQLGAMYDPPGPTPISDEDLTPASGEDFLESILTAVSSVGDPNEVEEDEIEEVLEEVLGVRSARLQESDAEWAAGEEGRQQALDEANQALNNFLEVYKTAAGIQESVPGTLDMLDAFSEYSNQAGIERQAMEEGTMPPPRPQPVAPPAPAANVATSETPSPSETPLTTSKKKKTDKDWEYYLNKAGITKDYAKKYFGIDPDSELDSASMAAPKKGESKREYRKRLEEFFKSDKGRGVIAKSSDFEEKLDRRNKAILSQRRAWNRTGFGSVDAHGIPSKGALTSAEMNSFSAQLNTTEEAIKRLMDKIGTPAESPTDIQQLNTLRTRRTALQDALQRHGGGTGSFLDRYTRKHVIPSLVRGMNSYNQVLPTPVVANPSNAYMFMGLDLSKYAERPQMSPWPPPAPTPAPAPTPPPAAPRDNTPPKRYQAASGTNDPPLRKRSTGEILKEGFGNYATAPIDTVKRDISNVGTVLDMGWDWLFPGSSGSPSPYTDAHNLRRQGQPAFDQEYWDNFDSTSNWEN